MKEDAQVGRGQATIKTGGTGDLDLFRVDRRMERLPRNWVELPGGVVPRRLCRGNEEYVLRIMEEE